jgi:protein-S-isoprenylcysteine O-methyltransferase Ste14
MNLKPIGGFFAMNKKSTVLIGAIVFYFIIGLEVLIMISPFAGFFYSVFNPFLLEISNHSASRWLSAFYLPHMTLPSDGLLRFIRAAGSVMFIAGAAVFAICAVRIYTARLLKRGAVTGGIYGCIRHPQYVALVVTGMGLSILWPRFLSLVMWLAMALIYYFLARDEERRMLAAHGKDYAIYMRKTGMFLPGGFEAAIVPSGAIGRGLAFVLAAAITIGGGFFLRHYTIEHLTQWKNANLLALAILPEDAAMLQHRMPEILGLDVVKSRLKPDEYYLVYLMPAHYIMQGMIADTGDDWKLYKKHHTMGMITDWILHPDSHLRGGHHLMHDDAMNNAASHNTAAHDTNAGDEENPFVRRLIFLRVEKPAGGVPSGIGLADWRADPFSIDARRVPYFMVDLNVHTLTGVSVRDLEQSTGWGKVPTPVF